MRKLNRNDKVLVMCVGIAVGMLGLAYASVPLYRVFCELTGFDGTPAIVATGPAHILDERIEVRFDTNVAPGLPWEFRANQGPVTLRIGESSQVSFHARNLSDAAFVGTSDFNVTPLKAAQYFRKTNCFCIIEQKLDAGQKTDFGVVFFVDPAITTDPDTKDVKTITLSYTFFPAKSATDTAAAAAARKTP